MTLGRTASPEAPVKGPPPHGALKPRPLCKKAPLAAPPVRRLEAETRTTGSSVGADLKALEDDVMSFSEGPAGML